MKYNCLIRFVKNIFNDILSGDSLEIKYIFPKRSSYDIYCCLF